jgi:type IV secretory pathway VirB10-like protein
MFSIEQIVKQHTPAPEPPAKPDPAAPVTLDPIKAAALEGLYTSIRGKSYDQEQTEKAAAVKAAADAAKAAKAAAEQGRIAEVEAEIDVVEAERQGEDRNDHQVQANVF